MTSKAGRALSARLDTIMHFVDLRAVDPFTDAAGPGDGCPVDPGPRAETKVKQARRMRQISTCLGRDVGERTVTIRRISKAPPKLARTR